MHYLIGKEEGDQAVANSNGSVYLNVYHMVDFAPSGGLGCESKP